MTSTTSVLSATGSTTSGLIDESQDDDSQSAIGYYQPKRKSSTRGLKKRILKKLRLKNYEKCCPCASCGNVVKQYTLVYYTVGNKPAKWRIGGIIDVFDRITRRVTI
ncbi:uncharacterized protein H6S33_004217 [Morchella sextelata]|uniref:uncharacterized protein n=1 Tax=Morchella sextelata TaxID=1174677 RepID=UPI001D04E904|nr:uncharacterized protein H6S33_004217 [Morchella sextelata]KAH0605760.1 hypothetical protein H6S33_004217 [Morchella sextelata]